VLAGKARGITIGAERIAGFLTTAVCGVKPCGFGAELVRERLVPKNLKNFGSSGGAINGTI